MHSTYMIQLRKIFVGREKELKELNDLWKATLEAGEHFVYVMLNAPGTGKTSLLKRFGEDLERKHAGLYFHYRCSSRYHSADALNADLMTEIKDLITTKYSFIQEHVVNHYREDQRDDKLKDLEELKKRVQVTTSSRQVTLEDIVAILKDLSRVIPLLFVADEIQEFQKSMFRVTSSTAVRESAETTETALHYFTRILKDLMQSRILMILSGTQYHILTQIGFKLGSPIAQKVEQLVINNFTTRELDLYVKEVQKRILGMMIPRAQEATASRIVEWYRQFLHAFSGGHPRTVVLISKWFLVDFPTCLEANPTRDEFQHQLLTQVENDFKTRILTREKQSQIRELQAQEEFHVVRDWILDHSLGGLALSVKPTVVDPKQQENVDDMVCRLMTVGIIVQNSLNKYYLTSYFHLLAFIESFTSEYELFLQQVLNNRFFQQLCGSHSGFGHSFKQVFLSAVMVRTFERDSSRSSDTHHFPIVLKDIQSVERIDGEIDWKRVTITPRILYHAPQAKGVDFFILIDNRLVLIQLTTSLQPRTTKIKALRELMDDVSSFFTDKQIVGWFVSLFPLDGRDSVSSERLIITDGQVLARILGKSLHDRLIQVKRRLAANK